MQRHMNQHIAVLKGGVSEEREVSLRSGAAVAGALRSLGHQVSEVDVRGVDFELPEQTDFVFNCLHGTFGEDGGLQKILSERGERYNGAGERFARIAFSKMEAKAVFEENGVPTPKADIWSRDIAGWEPPFILKPCSQGSSIGVFRVEKQEDVQQAFQDAEALGVPMMIEEMIVGRELTIGILDDKSLSIVEISPKHGFYDYKNKYTSGASEYACPANLPQDLAERIERAALKAHQVLGGEVYSRVDVMLAQGGDFYVLEVNTIPGMTELSLLPMAAKVEGMDFPELCQRIVDLSWEIER